MALFDKYSAMLRGVCMRYVKNDFDADDLLQEGFIKILKNITSYKSTGSFNAWMKRIMINQAINFYKKNNKQKLFELNEAYTEEIIDNESSNKIENRILDAGLDSYDILQIIKDLPEGYRMVLNLYAIDAYSHKEIAEKLNISINTSKSQLSRARKLVMVKTEVLLEKHKRL